MLGRRRVVWWCGVVVTSCSGSGGRAGLAQAASRVNLSRLLLLAGWVTSQYFTGRTNIGNLTLSHWDNLTLSHWDNLTLSHCDNLTLSHCDCYKEVNHLLHHQPWPDLCKKKLLLDHFILSRVQIEEWFLSTSSTFIVSFFPQVLLLTLKTRDWSWPGLDIVWRYKSGFINSFDSSQAQDPLARTAGSGYYIENCRSSTIFVLFVLPEKFQTFEWKNHS